MADWVTRGQVGSLRAGEGYPTFGGGLPDPDWANSPDPRYADFRRSPNIDDRRGDATPVWMRSLLREITPQNSGAEALQMMLHPLTPQNPNPAAPVTPLGVQAGMLDIVPGHANWLVEQARARQAAIQANPNIHSFNEPMDPASRPVALDHRKIPFGSDIAPNPVLAGRVPGATFNTPLDPGTEQFFRMWLAHNKVPFNPDATTPQDYDMRGFYQAAMQGNPKAQAAVDPNDRRIHYNDFWKTPSHETFGRESQWGSANGPVWNQQDQLLSQGGRVLFDDRAGPSPFGLPGSEPAPFGLAVPK